MDYCNTYFGKKLDELEYEDVKEYFYEERSESDQIEFKSINPEGDINPKIQGLIKSVCAFLNSSGGIIIWGAPVECKLEGKNEKVFSGGLTPLNEILAKDWLISKISDIIIPLPNNIRVKILTEECKCICIFEIQESDFSPHQTKNKYYMRIDGQTKPAPHHYIEALFKKVKFPNLEAYLKINEFSFYDNKQYFKVAVEIFFFNWSPLQNEEHFTFRLVSGYGKFGGPKFQDFSELYRLDGSEYYKDPAKEVFSYGEPIKEAEVIFYDIEEIHKNTSEVPLILSFGGKYSPVKSSEYVLHLSPEYFKNPNDMIIKKTENRLMIDIQNEKGMSKDLIIKIIMEE